jgi:hypothetical protein
MFGTEIDLRLKLTPATRSALARLPSDAKLRSEVPLEPYVHDAVLDMHLAREQLDRELDGLAPDDWSRFIPYGDMTVRDVLAHLAVADQSWAVSAQGLLRREGAPPLATKTPEEASAARRRAIERGRTMTVSELRDEMARRRKLLLALYDLLEPVHLSIALPSFGERHNSVRERIWRGYHDRLHLADIQRALRMSWHPSKIMFDPRLQPAIEALSPDETLYVIYSVDPVTWERKAPGLDWTYRQILAHIATGDWVFQRHMRHIIATGTVADWADIDAGNAERVEQRKFSNDRTLIEEYLSMRHETLLLIAQLKPQDLQRPITLWWLPEGERERTILDYVLAFERHERLHREQLRPAMKYATSTR